MQGNIVKCASSVSISSRFRSASTLSRRYSSKGRARHKYLDPHTSTKSLIAFCTAESYTLSTARLLFRGPDFRTDPVRTGLEEQVLHVQTLAAAAAQTRTAGLDATIHDRGDVFIFPSGSAVMWNVAPTVASHIVNDVLSHAAEKPHAQAEVENFAYVELEHSDTSDIVGDTIRLGTYANRQAAAVNATPTIAFPTEESIDEMVKVTLAQIAYSSALARSTKLAVLEGLLSSYFDSTRTIPSTLSAGNALPFTRSFILRKTGELLGLRAQLNLYSELTDSLPDLFWDTPHDLGLEAYYDSLGRALDVGIRIKVLNQRMDYASEIAAVLRERLSEKHSTGLEWLIIVLISIEVAFGVFHLVKESQEQEELCRVRHLLEKYLEMEITGKKHD